MDKSTREELYKVKLEELEKDLDKKNCKINSLKREVQNLTDELSRQTVKNHNICEARDENKFRIMELEKEVTVLRRENENLQSQLKQEKDIKKYKELSLEAEVKLYADQMKKYDQKIKACESKISELQASPSTAIAEISSDNNSDNLNIQECSQICQLEKDIKLLSLENNDLKCKLGEEREANKNEMQKLECQFTTCMNKVKENELREKDYESKICYLESKLKEVEYLSEERLTEIKKLQEELEIQKNIARNSEEVNIRIAHVQRELESLRQIQAETSEKKVMPAMRSVTREVSKIEQCKHTLITYAEQHRNLQMQFERQLNDQLQEVQDILTFDHEENIPKKSSPKGALPKAGKSEDLQIQKKEEPKVTSQKKSPRKCRALQEDENVSSPTDSKDSVHENMKKKFTGTFILALQMNDTSPKKRGMLSFHKWDDEDDYNLLSAMIGFKPLGVNKHFEMVVILKTFSKKYKNEDDITSQMLWEHLNKFYNLEELEKDHKEPFPNLEVEFSLPEDEYELPIKKLL